MPKWHLPVHTSEIQLQAWSKTVAVEEKETMLKICHEPSSFLTTGFIFSIFASEVLIVVFVVLDQIITKEKWSWFLFSI